MRPPTLDILTRVLVEGDVLSVDDGAGCSVVPAGLVSEGYHVRRVLARVDMINKLLLQCLHEVGE